MSSGVQPTATPLKRRLAAWLFRATAAALIAAPLGVAAIALSGMRNKLADVIAQFTAPTLTLTLALALGFVLIRQPRWALLALAACCPVAAAVGPQWFPDGPRAAAGAPVVRMYSANIHYLNDDVAAVRRSVVQADADIVVLIEVGREAARGVDRIVAGYPHQTVSVRMDQARGPIQTVVASRWPLTSRTLRADGLNAETRIVTPLGPVSVLAVHLARPWPYMNPWGQITQTLRLRQVVARQPGPVLVAGDFNSVSSARIGRMIQGGIGLHPAPAPLGTWPSAAPAWLGVTIDQVYASRQLAFVSRRLGRDNGSDHRPVITEITRAADRSGPPAASHGRPVGSRRRSTPPRTP